ncbi:MAG: hypothetical protein Q7S22_00760 [Candidatus Micrarchaeota archaeon]|nr:hypothetical protein [Candidatus Micrarchaeota archaeon]
MDFKNINFKKIFEIVKIPVTILIALTCVGIIINFFNNLILIGLWWTGVLLICTVCSGWAGFKSAKNNLSTIESGVAGTVTWIVPGAVGLTIGGLTSFLNALLWGAVEGYEAIAFIGGAVVILILLTTGAVISFIIGMIGGHLGKNKS